MPPLFNVFLQAVANALNLGSVSNAGYFLGFLTTIIALILTAYFARGKVLIVALMAFSLIGFYTFLGWFDLWFLLLEVMLIVGMWGTKVAGWFS